MLNDNQLDNFSLPFQIESANLRGRIVYLDTALDEILSPHAYPDAVADLVGQTQIITVLLSSMLKFEGIFTLQARADGPVSMLVSDMVSNGDIRACASFDNEKLQALGPDEATLNDLLGQGCIAFTVDHAGMKDRYQGVVGIEADTMAGCIQHYFYQSEQVKTGIKIAVGQREGKWIGAGIIIQALPEDLKKPANDTDSNHYEDSWQRAMVLLESCRDDELLSNEISAENLLFRLFHEDGVRVYPAQRIQKQCRCDEARVKNVVSSLSEDDRNHLIKDGMIEAKCEFCSTIYRIDPQSLTD